MKGRRMKSSRLSSDIAHPVSRTTLLLSMQWGYPVSCPWPAVSDRISVVERGRVRDADDQSLARQKPNYGLAPGLLARRVKERGTVSSAGHDAAPKHASAAWDSGQTPKCLLPAIFSLCQYSPSSPAASGRPRAST